MILTRVNFSPLYKRIEGLFSDSLPAERLAKIKDELRIEIKTLATANFRCYQANMQIIDARRRGERNPKIYSDLDLQVRVVGEYRVRAKSNINTLIYGVYKRIPNKSSRKKKWTTDDIVYSIGDMIDRLTIEWIKVFDYRLNIKNGKRDNNGIKRLSSKIAMSREWGKRVEKYLKWKLQEIKNKGYYERVEETRTYDMKDVL